MAREVTQGYCKDSACAYDVYTKHFIDEKVIPHLGGVKDYEKLEKKPKINGIELTGDKTLDELGILQSGIYVGDEEPTDENVNVWLDTSEEADIPTSGGLTIDQINSLNKMFKVCAYSKQDIFVEYETFKTAFGIIEDEEEQPEQPTKILESLFVSYTGGDVEAGTNINSLTNLIVKANYSDGTQEIISDYTLSGVINEGNNTITVMYQGLTTQFVVVGIAENMGEETGVSNETTWTSGVDYVFEPIPNEYPDKRTGEIKAYDDWSRTPHLYCKGASKLRVTARANTTALGGGVTDNAFYDENKNYVSGFTYEGLKSVEPGTYVDIAIPSNAAYFILSGQPNRFNDLHVVGGIIKLTPYE